MMHEYEWLILRGLADELLEVHKAISTGMLTQKRHRYVDACYVPLVYARLALIFYHICTTGPLFHFIPDLSLISILSSYVPLCPCHSSLIFCTDFPTRTFHSISGLLMTSLHCYCHASLRSLPIDVFSFATLTCYPTSGKPEKYLTGLADLFPAYSENKPIKNGDHGFKPY